MADLATDFLRQITEVVVENLSNEQFGVSELARAIGARTQKRRLGGTDGSGTHVLRIDWH